MVIVSALHHWACNASKHESIVKGVFVVHAFSNDNDDPRGSQAAAMNLMPPSLNEAQFSQMVFRLVTLLVSLQYD